MKSVRDAIPWVVLATALLRLPSFFFGILDIDDADFTVIARAVSHGSVLYRDVVDIKPPLTFVCYLPNAWGGGALWPVNLEGALFVAATALLLGVTAERTWSSPARAIRAGALGAFLALGAGLCDAPGVSTELLMNLPTAGALLLFARSEEKAERGGGQTEEVCAGVLLGVASLIRQHAAFSLVALGFAVLAFGSGGVVSRIARGARLAAGFAFPWALTLAAFWRLGAMPEMLEWVVLRNLRYVGQSAGVPALRLLQSLLVCVVAATGLVWWAALSGFRSALTRTRQTPQARLQAAWAVLLAVSCVPVCLGGRFYEHYFVQFVPALALLGAGPLDGMIERARAGAPWRRAVLWAFALGPAIGLTGYVVARGLLGRYPLQDARVQAIGAWARAETAPSDRLFVWGHYSPIYLAAERLPGTRYVTTSWQLGNFDVEHLDGSVDLRRFRSERDVARTLEDLARRKPEWVIDTSPADIHEWHKEPLSLLPDLDRAIDAGWDLLPISPGGARIFRRR